MFFSNVKPLRLTEFAILSSYRNFVQSFMESESSSGDELECATIGDDSLIEIDSGMSTCC